MPYGFHSIPTPASTTYGTTIKTKAAERTVIAVATENYIAANAAGAVVDLVNNTLSSRRHRRQIESSFTVDPISDCDDFSAKYNYLLDNLTSISDENIETIKQLTTSITKTVSEDSGIPCDSEGKLKLLHSTSTKSDEAKEKVRTYGIAKIREISLQNENITTDPANTTIATSETQNSASFDSDPVKITTITSITSVPLNSTAATTDFTSVTSVQENITTNTFVPNITTPTSTPNNTAITSVANES